MVTPSPNAVSLQDAPGFNETVIALRITLRTLISTTVDIMCFISNCITNKMCFQSYNSEICRDLNFTNNPNFQSLEVGDRGFFAIVIRLKQCSTLMI